MKVKPKILLLTNPLNEDPQEDLFLYQRLKRSFNVQFCHPLDTLPFERKNTLFLIRNIWPTHVYQKEFEKAARRWKRKGIKTYNSLDGRADLLGKNYLMELHQKGYSVVPTYTIKQAKKQLNARKYVIKPLFGADGSSMRVVNSLKGIKLSRSQIVQPLIHFEEELAFYFLDNKFHYALRFKNKLQSHTTKLYLPTRKEIVLAQKFVDWNTMSYGIQRVDVLRQANNTLLMNEIEDFCPYLYLEDLSKKTQTKFISSLINSLHYILIDR